MAEYAAHACRTGSPSMEMYSPLRKDNQKGVPKTQTTYRNIHSAVKKARFGGCSLLECCLLYGEGAETRTHFIAWCSRLEAVRVNFKVQLTVILSCKNPLNVGN